MLALLGQVLLLAAAGKPSDFRTCAECIEAGFGWSLKKGRCGGFPNHNCPEELLLLAGLSPTSKPVAPPTAASPLRCDQPEHNSSTGYRSGMCQGCRCCPLRWSCLEQHSRGYNCAERNSVQTQVVRLELPQTWVVGEVISTLSVDVGPYWATPPACHSTLPPGLQLRLAAGQLAIFGTLGFDPNQQAGYDFDFEAAATIKNGSEFLTLRVLGISKVFIRNAPLSGDAAKKQELEGMKLRTLQKHAEALGVEEQKLDDAEDKAQIIALILELNFSKAAEEPSAAEEAHAFSDTAAQAAMAAAEAGFAAFKSYNQHQMLSLENCISTMYDRVGKLAAIVTDRPSTISGVYWNWLGAMYMSMHKLLEDVLVDGCEYHLEQALLFKPSDEQVQTNLAGTQC